MICYISHGLHILSELSFPELTKKKSSHVDVIIRFGEVSKSLNIFSEVHLSKSTKLKLSSNTIHVFWNNISVFTIKNGTEVFINPKTCLNESFLRYLFFGHVFAILLHLKGRLVLHANAVNMDDDAVIFLGISGKGKSTTSFALHKMGHQLLSDDVLSIKVNGEHSQIYPGFPRIKLWPEVIRNFNEDPELMPKVHFNSDKRFYNVSDNFSHDLKTLKSIYLIEEGKITSVKDINSNESLMELIKSSYCFKLFNKNELSENFKQCSQIVNSVPVKRLQVNPDFDLKKLVEIIEMDLL